MQPIDTTKVFNSLVQDLSFGGIPLPFIGQAALGLVRIRYWVWWYSSRKKIVIQSNAAELGFGVLLNFSINNEKVRTAAKILLLIMRIESCVKQFRNLLTDCDELWIALRGENLKATDIKWVSTKNSGLFSPSFVYDFERSNNKIGNYVRNVAFCAYRILLRLDKLLMRSIDAHEALLADNEAMILSIVNSSQVLKRLFENHEELYKALESRKPMIEKCLSLFASGDSKEKTDQIMEAVKDSLGKGRELYQAYETVSSVAGEVGVDFLKRGVFGMFHVLNLTRYMPAELMPEPEQVIRARIFDKHYERFPPLEDVRCKT